jgi:hypothetical protein
MNTRYQSTSRSARTVAAVAAIATVIALFGFVAGLGDSKTDAVSETHAAASSVKVASIKSSTSVQAPVAQ